MTHSMVISITPREEDKNLDQDKNRKQLICQKISRKKFKTFCKPMGDMVYFSELEILQSMCFQNRRKSMPYTKSKSTKRFSFDIARNPTAKQAGSNTVTIATLPQEDSKYSVGQTSLTMTVREARALQGFLNDNLDYDGNPTIVS